MRGKIHGPYLARIGRANERFEKARAAFIKSGTELQAAIAEVNAAQDALANKLKEGKTC